MRNLYVSLKIRKVFPKRNGNADLRDFLQLEGGGERELWNTSVNIGCWNCYTLGIHEG